MQYGLGKVTRRTVASDLGCHRAGGLLVTGLHQIELYTTTFGYSSKDMIDRTFNLMTKRNFVEIPVKMMNISDMVCYVKIHLLRLG